MQKLLSILFILTSFALSAKNNHIKVTLEVYNNFGLLNNALAFIYDGDSLIGAKYVSKNGQLTLSLEKNKEYLFVVSNPGHISVKAALSTEKMYNDQIKKVYFPIRLYNIREKEIKQENITYKIKWNPILERFETYQLNMGWYDEILEENSSEKKTLLEE